MLSKYIFPMTLVQMVVQIWLILISFSTNLHYRALCAIFIWESNSSGVVKMLLHSSHMDLELKMVSKSVLWLPSNTKDTFEETYKSVHEGIEYPCTYVNVKQKEGIIFKNIHKWYMTVLDIFVSSWSPSFSKYNLRIHIECVHDVIKYPCSHCV